MEEQLGALWHRLVTRVARRSYPDAEVRLAEIAPIAGVLLRAFGGTAALRITAAGESRHGASRRLLERIAGSGERVAHAMLDPESLRLPESLALFPARALNRDLYLWLIALAATRSGGHDAGPACYADPANRWLVGNQQATLATLVCFPGLEARYRRLLAAHCAQRPDPASLSAAEAVAERSVRAALHAPGSVAALPLAHRPPQPVPLWLMPGIDSPVPGPAPADPVADADGGKQTGDTGQRQRARREALPDGRDGFMLPFRAESVLSWAEYVRVNRATDEGDEDALGAAREMDEIAITRGGTQTASRIRFDLDLPAAAQDDHPLGAGLLFPEWDWKRAALLPAYVKVQAMRARDAGAADLPAALRRSARRLRAQFSALAPQRRWLRAQQDGPELDLDALVRFHSERAAGGLQPEPAVYTAPVKALRDLACCVMADLSLSTDAHVSDSHRVVDVIRESLLLLGEALDASGDPFAFYGFSSLKRSRVRVHSIKEFDEAFDGATRGRVLALKPGYYTRMGAAIRFAAKSLAERPNALRLLLILTDGKPNDIDHYEGRYAIEDTAAAVREARQAGLRPFCVTVDRDAAAYLQHVFGAQGFIVIRRPEELPARLPLLYAQLRGL